MCKFHVSTPFHWFDFSPECQHSKMQIFAQIWPWNPSQVLQISCMIYFYYQGGFYHVFSKHSWNTHFCSINTCQNGSPQVRHVSYRSFSASMHYFNSLVLMVPQEQLIYINITTDMNIILVALYFTLSILSVTHCSLPILKW